MRGVNVTKMHGARNDFIVLDARRNAVDDRSRIRVGSATAMPESAPTACW